MATSGQLLKPGHYGHIYFSHNGYYLIKLCPARVPTWEATRRAEFLGGAEVRLECGAEKRCIASLPGGSVEPALSVRSRAVITISEYDARYPPSMQEMLNLEGVRFS